MRFTRRPDLAPQTRIEIVKLAWLYQGVYGKMTEIARSYQISRTFLYRLLLMATVQLETLFSDAKRLVQNDQRDFAHLLFLLRLEGHCSLLSMAAILQALDYHPHSVGFLCATKRSTASRCECDWKSADPAHSIPSLGLSSVTPWAKRRQGWCRP